MPFLNGAMWASPPTNYYSLLTTHYSLDTCLLFSSCEGVLHKHCDSHRTYAAGYGSDEGSLLLSGLELNVAAELAVVKTIHANVDNYSAFLDHVACNEVSASDSNYENISAEAYLLEVLGLGVADSYCAVLLEKQHSLRLANDIASADNYALLACDICACALDKAHNACGSTWQE